MSTDGWEGPGIVEMDPSLRSNLKGVLAGLWGGFTVLLDICAFLSLISVP